MLSACSHLLSPALTCSLPQQVAPESVMEILSCIDALGMGGAEGDKEGAIADLRQSCFHFVVQQPKDIFASILVKAMRGKNGKKKKRRAKVG